MWRRALVILPSLALAIDPADVSALGTPVTRTTVKGDVIGRADSDGIERFFGIPTAADTSGANRFTAPQPTSSWTTAIQTVREKMCAHMYPETNGTSTYSGQEDCISVDVITTAGATGLPVYVYFHGGGFMLPDPVSNRVTSAYYQKSATGDNRKAVSVFIHHRVGTLGFLTHPGLEAETSYGGSGNWGLLDCIISLQWIQDNIQNFGGDKTKVTIAGSSSGGSTVMLLSASPLAAGLFANAIAQSPYMGGFLKAGSFGYTARKEMASMLIAANNCSSGSRWPVASLGVTTNVSGAAVELLCMRGLPASALSANIAMKAQAQFDAVYGAGAAGLITYNSIQSYPVVDGYFLTQPPLSAWASGLSANVNFVIGMNQDEYALFYPNPTADYRSSRYRAVAPYSLVDHAYVLAMDSVPLTATLQQWVDAVFSASSNTALMVRGDAYNDDIAHPYQKEVQKSTDAWFASAIRLIVSTLVAQTGRSAGSNSRVYRYHFAQDPSETVTSLWDGAFKHMGACHGSEQTYTMGWYMDNRGYVAYDDGLPHVFSASEIALGVTMKSFWLNLMYNGNPGSVGSDTWSGTTASDPHTMVFKASLTGGAELDPCLDTTACRVESSKDYRALASIFWQDPAGTRSLTPPAPVHSSATQCSSGVTGKTQAAMHYSCGVPVLTSVSYGAAGLALLLVAGSIYLYAMHTTKPAGRLMTSTSTAKKIKLIPGAPGEKVEMVWG